MKRRIMILMALFAILFGFTANAQTVKNKEHMVKLDIPKGYTILTADNLGKNAEFLEKIGHTAESFKKKLTDSGILLYAATEDNRRQIQLKSWTSDFSVAADDLTRLSGDMKEQTKNTMLEQLNAPNQEILNVTQLDHNKTTFYRITVRVTGGEKDFCYIQYLTILNGRYYALVYYNDEATLTTAQQTEAQNVFETLSVERKKTGGLLESNTILQMVIIALVIIAAVVFIVIIGFSFYKDFKNRNKDMEPIPDRIRMRRKK